MNILYRFSLTISILLTSFFSFAQSTVLVTGNVSDDETGEALAGVNILITGTVYGTITNAEGDFTLTTQRYYPFSLTVSYVGYKTVEIIIQEGQAHALVRLESQPLLADEIVVTASRVEESILQSPVAIEKLDLRDIQQSPAPGFYEALEHVKGVQMTTSSITFKVPNTRGFNIPNNFRFVQVVDGVDIQAATLGVPLGNAVGPTELDVERIELTPGAASALYGMNAINGMANIITKDPFLYQGLSVYQKTGVNHVDGKDRDLSLLSETAIRYAHAFNQKLAFKLNLGYLRATDWLANSSVDQNPNSRNTANPAFTELNGHNNPAYDAWNRYGDENNNAITISDIEYQGRHQTFLVRRTGYWEKDLVNPVVENIKFDAALHYRLSDNAALSYGYRVGKMDGIFQRGNKIQLDNVVVQNHKLELKGSDYSVRTYVALEQTGDSYNLKPLADNLQLTHRANNEWRDIFRASLQDELDQGTALAVAMNRARAVADEGRPEPGTAQFQELKNTIIQINNWDHANAGIVGAPETGGAWLRQMSRTYHTDAQWDLSRKVAIAEVLVGADVRIFEVIPDGNNFVDFSRPIEERSLPGGDHVFYSRYGLFSQVTKKFLENKLKLVGSIRLDHNLEFTPKVNPRLAVVYTAAQHHNIRISFQNGFRFPSLFEALSFVNNGNVRRVGGLPYINKGLGYLDNSYTLESVNDFNAAVNRDVTAGVELHEAALSNRDRLVITDLSPTRPEQINSFEIGYKSVLFENTLFIDVDAYTNRYDGFLGQVEVSVPSSGEVGSDASVVDMLAVNRRDQTRYRVYTNARQRYHNYGASWAVSYNFYKKYMLSANVNYNDISENKERDVFVTGFNTPRWSANVSFGNREITKNIGFNIVWRWQDSFLWQSPLANGIVSSYQTVDAQASVKVPRYKTTIKVGGSNIFNQRYIQYAAGPTIGGLYYLSITADGLLSK